MPKQSRGFWVCISCEQAFDQYSEALHHEQFSCSRRPVGMVATVRPSPWQETTAVRQAPFSSSDPGPPGGSIHMQRSAEPFEAKIAPPLQRYIPVLGPQDPSPLRNPVDTLVCRSSEFFEVLTPDAGPAVGQVGLRCGFCVETPHSIRSYVFPSNVRSVAVSLRQPMMAHLKECPRYPDEYKQTLQAEPGDLRALGDFCQSRCHVAGVADRHGGGLVFARVQPQVPQAYYQPPEPRDDSASVSRGDHYSTGTFVPELPSGFPFIFVDNSRWICKYCARIPPPYRDAQNFWPQVTPPDARFIDYHLSVCREFQKSSYFPAHEVRNTMQPAGYAPWMEGQGPPPPSAPHQGASMQAAYHRPPAPAAGIPPEQHLEPGDAEAAQAIDYLEAHDLSCFDNGGNPISPDNRLVLEDDRLMLTEYFFYLMKQLRQVKFSEADRRTRGGKREKVKVGYGGLQCVHCVDIPQSRKFFWSNVDRLANSFAEIPAHIFRCKRCPQSTKDALLLLKKRHPEQMSRLPRGSQKIFFRRMWRRLHEEDANQAEQQEFEAQAPPQQAVPSVKTDASQSTGAGSEESAYFLRRPAGEAAKTLVDGSMQPGPPSPKSRVLLAIPEDRQYLSDMDCFTRRQLEVFCATAEDIAEVTGDKKHPIQEGQVGIRCLHCAMASTPTKGASVAYPFSINGIYETAREFERLHLDNCEHLPLSAKSKMESLKKGASSLSSIVRKYFVMAAKALGLEDTDNGIRAGATPTTIDSQAKFAFSEVGLSPDEATKKRKASSPATDAELNPKRVALDQSRDMRQPSSPAEEDTSSLKQAAI